jgi:hypothetical protein
MVPEGLRGAVTLTAPRQSIFSLTECRLRR